MKKQWKKICAMILSLVMCITMADFSVFAEEGVKQEMYTMPFSIQEGNVEIAYQIVNTWENGYQCEITLTNKSDDTVSGWQLSFITEDTVTSLWNCEILQNDSELCSIASVEYNGSIAPEASVSIGYTAEGCSYRVKDVNITTQIEDAGVETNIEKSPYIYVYEDFTVEYSVVNNWDENCNACVKITNTSEAPIENWNLVWKSEDTISNSYNATMTTEQGVYTLKNMDYNQDILPGETIECGFDVCYGEVFDIPQGFAITSYPEKKMSMDTYMFENIIADRWEGGYVGEIRITNTGDVEIREWCLTIQCEDIITNLWNGEVTDLGNGLYEIKNPQHAQNIQPQETIIIGYQAEGSQAEMLEVLALSASDENAMVSDESDGKTDDTENTDNEEGEDGNEEVLSENYIEILTTFEEMTFENTYYVEDAIAVYSGKVNNLSYVKSVNYEVKDIYETVVQSGEIQYNENTGDWTIENLGLVVGWNDVLFHIQLTDDTEIVETICYVNASDENMKNTSVDMQDTDGDGINNYFEIVCGTNPDSDDADGDGLTDFVELMVTGTDSTLYDTDGNGVSDADEDTDGDGLTTLEELNYGTSPSYSDSDLDGINDRTEIFEVGTDPLLEDTDEDGLTDGEEIKLGTNPLIADGDGDGVLDGEEKIEQQTSLKLEEQESAVSKVAVSLACSGDIENQVFIENTMETDTLSAQVVGLVGAPIEIHSMAPFETAEIIFTYDRTKLGDVKEEDLCIMWYDEEKMEYVLLEDSVLNAEEQTISYTTTHFSTYLLVDKKAWLDAWRQEINYDVEKPELPEEAKNYDIYLVLDYSVSPEDWQKEKEFAKKIIDQMVDGDRIALGMLLSLGSTDYYYNLISSKTDALYTLENMETAVANRYGIETEPKGNYNSSVYDYINLVASMRSGNLDSTNEKIGIFVSTGINKGSSGPFLFGYEYAMSNIKNMGFPLHCVSVTEKENEAFAALLAEYDGKSYVITELENRTEPLIEAFKPNISDTVKLDSDGDGLLDVYETRGIRIQNGKIVCLDPFKIDTDGDGVSDFIEIGGQPVEVVVNIEGEEYKGLMNHQESDPNDAESTGTQITPGYMIIDDFDYLPLSQKSYNKIYVDDTKEVDSNGNAIYGRTNIYGSNPDELNIYEIIIITTKAVVQHNMLEEKGIHLDADEFLMNYIGNKEDRRFFSYNGYLKNNSVARTTWAFDVYPLMSAAESCLKEGETKIIAQSPDNQNSGIIFSPVMIYRNGDGEIEEISLAPADFFAINEAETRVVAKVSYDGKLYKMELKYYLFDYYDWDKKNEYPLPLVSATEMYNLCRCGGSKFYENWGNYETVLSWEATVEGRNDALVKEKEQMKKLEM